MFLFFLSLQLFPFRFLVNPVHRKGEECNTNNNNTDNLIRSITTNAHLKNNNNTELKRNQWHISVLDILKWCLILECIEPNSIGSINDQIVTIMLSVRLGFLYNILIRKNSDWTEIDSFYFALKCMFKKDTLKCNRTMPTPKDRMSNTVLGEKSGCSVESVADVTVIYKFLSMDFGWNFGGKNGLCCTLHKKNSAKILTVIKVVE